MNSAGSNAFIPSGTEVKLNLSEMPRFRRENLFQFTLELVDKVFSIPGEEERYQEWLARRGSCE